MLDCLSLVGMMGLGELVSGYQSEGGLPPTHQPPLVVASGWLSPSIHYCDQLHLANLYHTISSSTVVGGETPNRITGRRRLYTSFQRCIHVLFTFNQPLANFHQLP